MKKNLFTRILTVVLVVVMVMSMAACGGKATTDAPAQNAGTATETKAPTTDEGAKLCVNSNLFPARRLLSLAEITRESFTETPLSVFLIHSSFIPERSIRAASAGYQTAGTAYPHRGRLPIITSEPHFQLWIRPP